MVGIEGLLRLSRWWRQHDAGSSGCTGDGAVYPKAEGDGGDAESDTEGLGGATAVGTATGSASTTADHGSGSAGQTEEDGEVR